VLHKLIESVNASAATSMSDLLAAHPSSRPRRTESLATHVDFPEAAALARGTSQESDRRISDERRTRHRVSAVDGGVDTP
jgi:hypothetical protein